MEEEATGVLHQTWVEGSLHMGSSAHPGLCGSGTLGVCGRAALRCHLVLSPVSGTTAGTPTPPVPAYLLRVVEL